MKKVVLSLGFLFCITLIVNAQDAASNANAPVMTFDSEIHDFGTIDQGGDGTYLFKFKNTGKEPLIISNAKGSCGCTVPSWPKEPIGPGATGTIKVTYDTKRLGGFTKTVTISSNSKTPEKVITIKGTVKVEETFPYTKTDNGAIPYAK
jgi:hypothetical protein